MFFYIIYDLNYEFPNSRYEINVNNLKNIIEHY